MRALAPALLVSGVLGLLAVLLEHGREAGLPLLTFTGRVYFGLLMLAPLVVLPLAWRLGASLRVRVAVSLVPGFLWWLTEVGVRLRWHTPAESLWLAASPFNALHLWSTAVAIAVAELGCRLAVRRPVRPWRAGLVALGLVAGLGLVVGSIFPFLYGYRALFQGDLLPMPESLPGPLEPGSVAPATSRLPNVVFILSDDHRWDFTGYEGHPFVETPALDRLAEQGVSFTRAYVTSSLCSPSRASFLTGTYPHLHGVWNNFTPWSDDNRTFFEYLKPAGYRTAFIGKWHMPGSLPDLRGVDHFVTFTNLGGQGVYEWCPLVVNGRDEPSRVRYIAEELTNRAIDWIEERPAEPFVLYLSHKSVHADFVPDEPERGSYADAPVPLPEGAQPWTHLTNAQYTHLTLQPLDDAIRKYGEAIASLDRQIGRLLDRLDELGLADDTLVIYSSDNGYLWGERGLTDKRWPYELSIRVPLLLRWPASGHAQGVRVDRIVANVDLAPSLLALAGIEAPERMQGRSLLPLLQNAHAPWRDALLYAYYFEPPYPAPSSRALVTERYKLVEYDAGPPELYDLAADPQERRDLASSPGHAEIRARLEDRLEAARREIEP